MILTRDDDSPVGYEDGHGLDDVVLYRPSVVTSGRPDDLSPVTCNRGRVHVHASRLSGGT